MRNEESSQSITEAEELDELVLQEGNLSKWTNYIHGWQNRFFVLKDGNLSYYKSSQDTEYGCRGSVLIGKASVAVHDLDELRFDVCLHDCVWYLRAQSPDDRRKWLESIDNHKKVAALQEDFALASASSIKGHRRQGSEFSLGSNSVLSAQSKGSQKIGHRLNEKLSEMETYRSILCRQVDGLQSCFESIPQNSVGADYDLRGEVITFKATTAGILATMDQCVELLSQREEHWKRKWDRETSARRSAEEKLASLMVDREIVDHKQQHRVGPDYVEGPFSQMGEDEFFDAIESELDKMEEEMDMRDKLKSMSVTHESTDERLEPELATKNHHLWPEIDRITKEQLHYARLLPGGSGGTWMLFAEDGDMKMYKREQEVDGMVVDPLKALHQIQGVTAREICHYFFSPDVRMEWEITVDSVSVIERISNDCMIFLQLHKRIWPTAQRDSCFWSHIRKARPEDVIDDNESNCDDKQDFDTWIVVNKSTDHVKAPKNVNGVLRLDLVVSMTCDTIIAHEKRHLPREQLKRSDISAKVAYCSVVKPGGWAPATVLRTVYKREYPRFLRRFTEYMHEKTDSKPIMW